MTPDEAIAEVERGKLRPIYLIVGEERVLATRVIAAVRAAAGVEATAGFNVERMSAGEVSADAVVAAARTVPMMAPRRLVQVTGIERWDRGAKDTETGDKPGRVHPLDVLADYAKAPNDTAVLLLVGNKLNGSRRLARAAKKEGYLVACEPLRRGQLPGWIRGQCRALGHAISPGTADALAELVGPELSKVVDAIERLSLLVGEGAPIDEEALALAITRVRQEEVWALVDALAQRDLGRVLEVLGQFARGPRGYELSLLGSVGWRVRQLIKYRAARREGRSVKEAASQVGVRFNEHEIDRAASRLSESVLTRWVGLLSEADLALKGSRRGGHDVLATMLVEMCRGRA